MSRRTLGKEKFDPYASTEYSCVHHGIKLLLLENDSILDIELTRKEMLINSKDALQIIFNFQFEPELVFRKGNVLSQIVKRYL